MFLKYGRIVEKYPEICKNGSIYWYFSIFLLKFLQIFSNVANSFRKRLLVFSGLKKSLTLKEAFATCKLSKQPLNLATGRKLNVHKMFIKVFQYFFWTSCVRSVYAVSRGLELVWSKKISYSINLPWRKHLYLVFLLILISFYDLLPVNLWSLPMKERFILKQA